MRIIHIVENLDKGAVESWLVKTFLLCTALRKEWSWTFYCILGLPGRLDETVRNNGGTIIYAPVGISEKWAFLSHFRKILLEGKFDIIHSHHDFLSGFYLLASRGIKFKKRILHIHNNDRIVPVKSMIAASLLVHPLKLLGYWFTDLIVGISKHTVKDFTRGIHFGLKPPTRVLYYGVDFSLFRMKNINIREQLKLSPETKLLIFVGRMNPYKNPLFALEVFFELWRIRKDIHLILVGKGELEAEIEARAESLGIRKQISVLGWRGDTPEIMMDSNVFIFPRLETPREGLGLVVVEAQAAGLQLFITKGIVNDAIVVHEMVNYLTLASGALEWAKRISDTLDSNPPVTQREALRRLMDSHFELRKATHHFISLYES